MNGKNKVAAKSIATLASSRVPAARGIAVHHSVLVAAIFILVFVAFLRCVQNEFLYSYGDDPIYVTENIHVKTGLTWENIKWAFPSVERSNWHPVTWISHMIDCELYGLKPWGHHLTSILFHAMNAALVLLVLRNLTNAVWRSLIVALLFALHPLRVESVAWVAERKDVLSTFFWMLTLLMYVRYVRVRDSNDRRRALIHYSFALFFFACGLMSKAMVVTLPCVMLLLDVWPLRRMQRATSDTPQQKCGLPITRLLIEKIPFVVLVIVASVYTYLAQNKWGFVQSLENYPLSTRLANALVSYVRYLGKMVWPLNLSSYYPHPGHWPLATVLLAVLVLAVISAVAIMTFRKQPYVAIGWCWYLGTLVPVIGIVQLATQAMADRYTYIPMIGILIVVVWGAHDLACNWRLQRMVSTVVVPLILIPCAMLTQQRIRDFKDGSTRWRHDLAVTGEHGLAQFALGLSFDKEGHTDEGIRELIDIIKAKPDWAEAHCNLGIMLCKKERYEEAIPFYLEAIRLNPRFTQAHHYLGFTLFKQGKIDEAIEQLQATTEMMPSFAPAHAALAMALESKGQPNEAIAQYQQAIRYQPDYPQAYNSLGLLFLKQNRTQEAVVSFEQAVKLKPDYAEAVGNLAAARRTNPRP